MKSKKFWKGVLSFLCFVIVATAINMGIKVAMEGMWLLGIPEPEAVSSVTIKHQYETEQIKEITDPEQIETCVFLTGFLKYRPFADPEVATGKASPRITFYYHLNNGDTVEVSANANTVFYNGKKHVLKDDDSFVHYVEGLFFSKPMAAQDDCILHGVILDITGGTMLVEPLEGENELEISDRFQVPIVHMQSSPEPQVGDFVEILYDGSIEETYPAQLGNITRIDLVVTSAGAEEKQGDATVEIEGIVYCDSKRGPFKAGFPAADATIVYTELPVEGVAPAKTISAYAVFDDHTAFVMIDGEWYEFLETERGGQPEPFWDYPPMVMVNGELYIDTGKKSTVDGRCGNMDGQITSSVPQTEMPTENNQSNFGTGFGYQYGPIEGTIEIYINDTWWVYATEEVRNK